MRKSELKKRFLEELESGLPEIEGMPQKKEAIRPIISKKPLLAIVLSMALVASAAISAIVVANNLANAASSPYFDSILSLFEPTSSSSPSALPDFRYDLMNQENGFYLTERERRNDDLKLGLYLPNSLAREAEEELKTDDLLRNFVPMAIGGGCISYSSITDKYLKKSKIIEFKASDTVSFHRGSWELVGLFYQCRYLVVEEIAKDRPLNIDGVYFTPSSPKRNGETIVETVEPFQISNVCVSTRMDFFERNLSKAINIFDWRYSHYCGFIQDGQFCYHGSYYSPLGEHCLTDPHRVYSIPELDEASTVLYENSSANVYTVPYETFKTIVRERALYYRVPTAIAASASFRASDSSEIAKGGTYLIEEASELAKLDYPQSWLAEYDDAYFEEKALMLLSRRGEMSVGKQTFKRLDRRGDNLEAYFEQEKSYETRDWAYLWFLEFPKSELEGKNPGFIQWNIDVVEPEDPESLNVFTNPSFYYGYQIREGGIADWEITGQTIQEDFRYTGYDASISFQGNFPFVPKDDGNQDPNYYWQIEKLVKRGNTIEIYLQIPPFWIHSQDQYAEMKFFIHAYQDFLREADQVEIKLSAISE